MHNLAPENLCRRTAGAGQRDGANSQCADHYTALVQHPPLRHPHIRPNVLVIGNLAMSTPIYKLPIAADGKGFTPLEIDASLLEGQSPAAARPHRLPGWLGNPSCPVS